MMHDMNMKSIESWDIENEMKRNIITFIEKIISQMITHENQRRILVKSY